MSGVKHDGGKLPMQLISPIILNALAAILGFGAKKYAPRNWEAGMDWGRVYGALLRHLTAWWSGESKDAETGMSHLWHAACCIMFLVHYEHFNVGKDDRPVMTNTTTKREDSAYGAKPEQGELFVEEFIYPYFGDTVVDGRVSGSEADVREATGRG